MGKKSKENFEKLQWKAVKVEGALSGEDFQGFAGLEVLESYDSKILAGGNKRKKRDFAISELDGDILSSAGNEFRSKSEDDVDDEQPKRKKAKSKTQSTPGKYVLLKPREDEEENFFESAENQTIRNTWYKTGIVSDEIIKALVEMKFTTPTEIQQLTIPAATVKCDILGAAQTGSGKTLAFGLPLVQSIQKEIADDDSKMENLFGLILTPTRELATQINNHLKAIAKYTNVSIACIIGGLAQVKQERVLNSCPHIVIGTPGRIWELISDGNEHLKKLVSLKYLVIDETDRMIEKGHFAELEQILDTINNEQENSKRQTFVFSATLTMVHELPDYVMKKKKKLARSKEMTKEQRLDTFISLFGMKNPKVFDITNNAGVAEKLVGESLNSFNFHSKLNFLF
jgi:ATP-dependent RNA helicase DDX24/MAK5